MNRRRAQHARAARWSAGASLALVTAGAAAQTAGAARALGAAPAPRPWAVSIERHAEAVTSAFARGVAAERASNLQPGPPSAQRATPQPPADRP